MVLLRHMCVFREMGVENKFALAVNRPRPPLRLGPQRGMKTGFERRTLVVSLGDNADFILVLRARL